MSGLNSVMEEYTLGEKNIFNLPNYDILDGVILDTAALLDGNGTTHPEKIYDDIKRRCSKPVVALDMPIKDLPLVHTEDENVMREMVRHAVNVHGKTNLCLISGPPDDYAGRFRMDIFLDEARKLGIEVPDEHIIYSDFWYTGGSAVAKDISEGKISMPDAVICGNDYLAIGLIYKLKKNNIRVPEDMIVIGYEVSDEGAGNDISVTSAEPNDALSAAKCVDYIRKHIDPDKEIMPYSKEFRFFRGMSCGCQPDHSKSINEHIYHTFPNYADEEIFDHVDIGLLMESYISEKLTASKTHEDCIQNININSYLILPFVNFYLCLRTDWLDENGDITEGYPEKMKIAAANTRVSELYFHSDAESIVFDTKMMIPRIYDNTDEKPSVYYFSPVHFGEITLGYCVLQRWMDDDHRLNLVYRNWIRFVNNALEMSRSRMKLLELSVRDEMTGALNRRGMDNELNRMLAEAKPDDSLFICVIDMDRLKYINDTFGHTEGDHGIKTVSSAALAVTANGEITVRAGGDEFYIIGVGKYDSDAGEKRIKAFENVLGGWR